MFSRSKAVESQMPVFVSDVHTSDTVNVTLFAGDRIMAYHVLCLAEGSVWEVGSGDGFALAARLPQEQGLQPTKAFRLMVRDGAIRVFAGPGVTLRLNGSSCAEGSALQSFDDVLVAMMPGDRIPLVLALSESGASWTALEESVEEVFPGRGCLADGTRARRGGQRLLCCGNRIFCRNVCGGVDLAAEGLVRKRKGRTTCDHISLHVRPGQFVAVIGGSGSGKSTLLDELNGREPADEGRVWLDGADLYANFKKLCGDIGFVPQQDIIHDDLPLRQTLYYASRLRMPPNVDEPGRKALVNDIVQRMRLSDVQDNLVGKLSGGQRKRASIAVELIYRPRLLMLDEPTSGLDPAMERDLMRDLAHMAHEGQTVVVVTHTIANIDLCDSVVVLGQGGRLCYVGPPASVPGFFGVNDVEGVYDRVSDEQGAEFFQQKFEGERALRGAEPVSPRAGQLGTAARTKDDGASMRQFSTLRARYTELAWRGMHGLPGLAKGLQVPLLALFIAYFAGNDCLHVYERTKFCLFALSCATFWVGLLDSIEEICSERAIFGRERDSGVGLLPYVGSKMSVLAVSCVLKSLLLTACFAFGLMQFHQTTMPVVVCAKVWLTSLFIMLSAMAAGLLVSAAMLKKPGYALVSAPVIVMLQILLSGVVCELTGPADLCSMLITCRWGMSAYGAAVGLINLPLSTVGKKIEGEVVKASWDLSALRSASDSAMFDRGPLFGLWASWAWMIILSVVALALCLVLLALQSCKRRR